MITKTDMKVVEISLDKQNVAGFFAKRREIFEYPRLGYGDYNTRGSNNIKNGLLGELAFLDLVYEHINKKYGSLEAVERCETLKGKFSYKVVLGDFDDGFEFTLNGKTIDVKTYGTRIVGFDEIYERPYNLFVDAHQTAHADVYVQAFILENNKICIAGYSDGVPSLASWMPRTARTCAVPDLLPIIQLLEEL